MTIVESYVVRIVITMISRLFLTDTKRICTVIDNALCNQRKKLDSGTEIYLVSRSTPCIGSADGMYSDYEGYG